MDAARRGSTATSSVATRSQRRLSTQQIQALYLAVPTNEAEVFQMVLADQEREPQGGFPTDKWRSFAQSKVGRAGTSMRSKL